MYAIKSPEDKGNLNTPVPSPHTIPYYYVSHILLSQVENTAVDNIPVSGNCGNDKNNYGATDMVHLDGGGNYPYSTLGRIEDSLILKTLSFTVFISEY